MTRKKLKDWKAKCLSFAGRVILIKVVAQAIPNYVMSSFLIPKCLCKYMDNLIAKFWWGDSKIHWRRWNNLCRPKDKGGMHFRNFEDFNWALLVKQTRRMHIKPNTLVAKVLKAKYFPNTGTLKSKIGRNPSYLWRSIHSNIQIINKGNCWNVGNINKINIWKEN